MQQLPFLCLQEITLADEAAFGAMLTAWEQMEPAQEHLHALKQKQGHSFAAYVTLLQNQKNGVGLAAWQVPCTTFFLRDTRSGDLAGFLSLRHRLTEGLCREGGHIGYAIAPAYRRQGWATYMLHLGLIKAREIGLTRVLLTCNKKNIASARVMQNNGGVLDSELYNEEEKKTTQRYWIAL